MKGSAPEKDRRRFCWIGGAKKDDAEGMSLSSAGLFGSVLFLRDGGVISLSVSDSIMD